MKKLQRVRTEVHTSHLRIGVSGHAAATETWVSKRRGGANGTLYEEPNQKRFELKRKR
ncbi:hypothetical protein BO85DRAFT_447174 [Aspergillus piperis CBS 112811]|uniref:Uncharacterized protein n=1 Tax=Aspergillus piperis CBS 112811 TaxID=1448313 RepID=A0A8G1R7G3_9EURO|nr:hypothetical protein BO85DRAFT_447174 [Aspergillus piperis CBS 112811]RAH60602.1 hypothetical protein BO85DRAFT_447174 [Aspergillus piperis CBS 112811]